jgi:beta-lactamase superfamily II metal-dependent hydrolase
MGARGTVARLGLAAGGLVCAVLLISARPADEGLRIFVLDVDGGAATLVVTPEKESILIDSGWPGFEDRDPKRIVEALKLAGCDHLDHLVTTHWHRDHFGGVEGLAKLVEVKQYWDRGMPEDRIAGLDFPDGPRDDDPLVVAYRKASAGKRKALLPGDRLPLKGEVEAIVLTSGGKVYLGDKQFGAELNTACEAAPSEKPNDNSDNARSLTLLFRLGEFEFLDCGDLTWNVEKALVCDVDRVKLSAPQGKAATAIDVFQVTHHGADSSNNPVFVRSIAPTVAIMNNGPRKGGEPNSVRTFKSAPSVEAFYALHKNVNTSESDNADAAMIANAGGSSGRFVQVSVAAGGGSYEVRVGTDGPARRFTAR